VHRHERRCAAAHERSASTSNRNFEGRQGKDSRTHLVSPVMAAAAAIAGHFVDVRDLNNVVPWNESERTMSTVKNPKEKKRLSLERDCRNVYGENPAASRKGIAKGKQRQHQNERRGAAQALAY